MLHLLFADKGLLCSVFLRVEIPVWGEREHCFHLYCLCNEIRM